jgi:hypothetical protein
MRATGTARCPIEVTRVPRHRGAPRRPDLGDRPQRRTLTQVTRRGSPSTAWAWRRRSSPTSRRPACRSSSTPRLATRSCPVRVWPSRQRLELALASTSSTRSTVGASLRSQAINSPTRRSENSSVRGATRLPCRSKRKTCYASSSAVGRRPADRSRTLRAGASMDGIHPSFW